MPFSNPIIGGGGALIREAIQSPDYAPGVAGWAIKRDGSAEFNDATVRGTLLTGAAGGSNTYIEVTDSPTGSELRIFSPDGTESAVLSAPLGGGTGTTPTVTLVSGRDNLGSLGATGRGQLNVSPEATSIVSVRASDGAFIGGSIQVTPDAGAIVSALNGSGLDDGGRLEVTSAGFGLTADVNNGSEFDQLFGDSGGIGMHGRLKSSAAATVTPGAGWSLTEGRMRQWGPMCFLHIVLTRTGAMIPAGVVASVDIATVNDALPLSLTTCAARFFGGTASVSVSVAGGVNLTWVSGNVNTGLSMFVNAAYWGNPAP